MLSEVDWLSLLGNQFVRAGLQSWATFLTLRFPVCPAAPNITLVCPTLEPVPPIHDGQHWAYFVAVILPYSVSLELLAFLCGWCCGRRTSSRQELEDISQVAIAQVQLIRSRNGAGW